MREGDTLNNDDELYGKLFRRNENKSVFSQWLTVAKMLGNVLDLNCALFFSSVWIFYSVIIDIVV